VLVTAEELAAGNEALAAREMNAAHRAADHILTRNRSTLGRRLRGRRLLAFDTAKPSDDEVYDDDQRD
jgi:hypothetical protein